MKNTTAHRSPGEEASVRLITLDPGHFHAALVQKSTYPQVDPVVHVYAPEGPDLDLHLALVEGFNTRDEEPTAWETKVCRGEDSMERMLAERSGNVVVLAGNNARKIDAILGAVEAGLNVLADKPMVIKPEGLPLLRKAFEVAAAKGILLYDIMTERHEITSMLQRALSRIPSLYGEQDPGSPGTPAVTKESVHHYYKDVSGKPLIRPWWFFDVEAEGEGIVDVSTHLVDLIQWELFPERILAPGDLEVISARTWTTPITLAEFGKATGLSAFPADLGKDLNAEGVLDVRCNGEFVYKLRGVHCKVSVIWNYEAPEATQDTHYSIMQGSKCALVIRQGAEQDYKPTLYVEPVDAGGDLDQEVQKAVAGLQEQWPGVAVKQSGESWELVVPESYMTGHEAHFAQVTGDYLEYLEQGRLPDWEVPNMLVKYHTIMEAYRMSRSK